MFTTFSTGWLTDAGTRQTCAFVNGSYFVFEDSAETARHAGADSGWELYVGPDDVAFSNQLEPAHIAGCDRIFANAPTHLVPCDEPADASAH